MFGRKSLPVFCPLSVFLLHIIVLYTLYFVVLYFNGLHCIVLHCILICYNPLYNIVKDAKHHDSWYMYMFCFILIDLYSLEFLLGAIISIQKTVVVPRLYSVKWT